MPAGNQIDPETVAAGDIGADPTPAQLWSKRLESAEKQFHEWRNRNDRIMKLYLDERGENISASRRYAMLWANTEVLKPTVYSRSPNPAVTRRFRDKDPVGRQVSDILERALISQFELNDADETFRLVRDEFVLVARGTAWIRYEVAFADHDPDRADAEDVFFDHVHYSDFVHPSRRKWKDVPWVARRVWMDDNAIEERFGKEKLELIRSRDVRRMVPDQQNTTMMDRDKRNQGTTPIYEIWDKKKRKVFWVCKGLEDLLDEKDPGLKLRGFFPTPRPAYGTISTNGLMPVPDYCYYQDQAQEIDQLTEKIGVLVDALKLVGFYPAAMDGSVSEAIELATSPNNKDMLVPVPGWAQFQSSGGSGDLIQWWPVEAVINTIVAAIETRRAIIGDIYQITGISDIVRGESDPRETLGAQEIKSQFGAIRIREKQREIQRYIADLTAMAGEVIAELFDQETLSQITGINLPTQEELDQKRIEQQLMAQLGLPAPMSQGQVPDAATQAAGAQGVPALVQGMPVGADPTELMDAPDQDPAQEQVTWDQVMELLRNDRARSYRVEIETDSTLEPDETREREQRNQLVEVIAVFLERVAPIIRQAPTMGRMLGELLMFQLRAYRIGRQLEQIIEETIDQLIQETLAAAQEEQVPEAVQIEQMRTQAKLEAERMGAQIKAMQVQTDQQAAGVKLQLEAMVQEQNAELDRQKAAADIKLQREKAEAQMALERLKAEQQKELEIIKVAEQTKIEIAKIQAQAALQDASNDNQTAEDGLDQAGFAQAAREVATAFADAMNAPREIVRDADGVITGSRVAG